MTGREDIKQRALRSGGLQQVDFCFQEYMSRECHQHHHINCPESPFLGFANVLAHRESWGVVHVKLWEIESTLGWWRFQSTGKVADDKVISCPGDESILAGVWTGYSHMWLPCVSWTSKQTQLGSLAMSSHWLFGDIGNSPILGKLRAIFSPYWPTLKTSLHLLDSGLSFF